MREHDVVELNLLLQWALNVSIVGRVDAVLNARRVLLYLVSRTETRPEEMDYGISHILPGGMKVELGMSRQTMYRALNRLLNQGIHIGSMVLRS